jgi:hypothetical protein
LFFRDYGCGKATSFGDFFRKDRRNQMLPGRGFLLPKLRSYDSCDFGVAHMKMRVPAQSRERAQGEPKPKPRRATSKRAGYLSSPDMGSIATGYKIETRPKKSVRWRPALSRLKPIVFEPIRRYAR